MGESNFVEMGVCDVSFKGSDLGFTKGFVKVNYSTESLETTVDQLDAPVSEVISEQKFEVVVPLAEHSLARLSQLLPGASVTIGDGTKEFKGVYVSGGSYVDTDIVEFDGKFWEFDDTVTESPSGAPQTADWKAVAIDNATNKIKMELSGASDLDLDSTAGELVLKPTGGDANDWITLKKALPVPSMSFSFEKENPRVYEMTFKALADSSGWVVFGDETAGA